MRIHMTPTGATTIMTLLYDDKAPAKELFDRKPPSDAAAEAAIIGAILIDPERFTDAAQLGAVDFSDDTAHKIWRAMLTVKARGQRIDPTLLHAELTRQGEDDGA